MRDHDDDLDLSAWEAPPPPEGLADAVIARMGGTAVGLAMPAQDDEPRRRRWIVIAASAAAVLLLSLGTWIIVRGREHAPPTSGEIVATRAQHLELGGVSAELDRGADVTWRRDGAIVHVEQKAGTAQWRVAGDQQVVIGAAVASPVSIDATGATLRVEVPMNMSDARVIGASAITAAAVAMVTVVVYEGHVKVTSAGQTVVVQPGTTFTVPPPAPPQPEPPVVGVAPVDPSRKLNVAVLGLEGAHPVVRDLTEGLRTRAKVGTGPYQLTPGSDKELVDEKILHNCADEAPACMATIGDELGADALIYGHIEAAAPGYSVTLKLLDVHRKAVERSLTEIIPASESSGAAVQGWAKKMWIKITGADTESALAADQIDAVMKAHASEVRDCFQKHTAPGQVVIDLAIEPDGTVASAIPAETPDAALGTCVANAVAGFAFPASSGRTRAKYPFAFSSGTCDAQALEDKGVDAEGLGQHAMALSLFEQALKCKPGDERLVRLAFMTSCQMKYIAKARTFWRQLSAADQPRLLQICIREGITKDDLAGGGGGGGGGGPDCDADALLKQGIHDGAGMLHDKALHEFEQALECKPGDLQLTRLAMAEACNLGDLAKARSYYEQLDKTNRGQIEQMCFRNGISHDALEGKLGNDGIANIYCKPDAKIIIDGKDTGQTTPAHLRLSAGKHKLTFVLGQDRFTYPLTIKAGESETISKDLQ